MIRAPLARSFLSRTPLALVFAAAALALAALAQLAAGRAPADATSGRRSAPAGAAARAAAHSPLAATGQLGGIARAVAIDGERAYLGVGARLRVYGGCDDPLAHLLGETDVLPGVVEDVAVGPAGDVAWLALGAAGVWAVDVGNPSRPFDVGRDAVPADVDGVPVEAHRLAVDRAGRRWVATNVGLVVVGRGAVTHMRAPEASLAPEPVHDVALSGAYALVAWGAHGLRVLHADAFDAVRPVGHLALANAQAVAAAPGGRAWVADGPVLRAVDVGDPTAPAAVGELAISATGGDGRAIALRGTTVLVAFARAPAAVAALAAVDGRDPAAPALLQTEAWPATLAQLDDGTIGGLGLDVAAGARWAVVGGDILGHRAVEIDRWLEGDRTAFAAPATAAVVPHRLQLRADTPAAWLACGRDGIVPTAIIGEDPLGERAYMVRAAGLALAAPVGDVAPLAPPGLPYGRYALVAARQARVVGLEPVPGAAEQLLVRGTLPELGLVDRAAVVGDIGVTVDAALGFAVLDLANPLAPAVSAVRRVTDTAGLPLAARDLALDPGGKRRAAVVTGTSVVIVDFSRRDQPVVLGQVALPGAAAVAWDVDRLWVATDAAELLSVAVDDAGAPATPAAAIALAAPAGDLTVHDGLLYAALGPLGVGVVDVSGPVAAIDDPIDTPGWAGGVGVDLDGRVWVADRAAGVIVLDVPSGLAPTPGPSPTVPPQPTACPRPIAPRLWLPAAERP